ncbi:putative membrane protein [Phyllobacterium sp. 1468]|nr:putative membrane protein [Phyllobacterium sp. 1468]
MREMARNAASDRSEAEVKEHSGPTEDIRSIRSLIPLALGMLVFMAALASLMKLLP